MDADNLHHHRLLVVTATVAIVSWGIAGLLQEPAGWTDALYAPDYTIPGVGEDSPLANAGFRGGDTVVSVEGFPVQELGMYSRWPRSLSRRPGESITMVVKRDGNLVSGEVIYGTRPAGPARMQLVGAAIALSFLGFGLWTLFAFPTDHAARLSYIGVALGLGIPGPNVGTWNGVKDHIQIAGMVLGALLLLRFFLFFPRATRIGQSRMLSGLLLVPWVVLVLCLGLELIYHPRYYHTFGALFSLLLLLYLALAAVAVVLTGATSSRQELRESGMWLILCGIGIAVIASLVAVIDGIFIWRFDIPGSGWLPLTIVLVPAAMAAAVKRHTRARGVL